MTNVRARSTDDTPSRETREEDTTKAPVDDRGLCFSGADDQVRTGDLNLGKVALYQLSYVRIASDRLSPIGASTTYLIQRVAGTAMQSG